MEAHLKDGDQNSEVSMNMPCEESGCHCVFRVETQ